MSGTQQQQQPQAQTQPAPPPSQQPATAYAEEVSALRQENQRISKLYSDSEHMRSELESKLFLRIKEYDAQGVELAKARAAAATSTQALGLLEQEYAKYRAQNNPEGYRRHIEGLEGEVEALQAPRAENERLRAQVAALTARVSSLTDARAAASEATARMLELADSLKQSLDTLTAKCAASEEAAAASAAAQRDLAAQLEGAEQVRAERDALAARVAGLEARTGGVTTLGALFCGDDAAEVCRIAGALSSAGRPEDSIALQELCARLDARHGCVGAGALVDREARAKAERELGVLKSELKSGVLPEMQRLRSELTQLRTRYEDLFACLGKIRPQLEALTKENGELRAQSANLEKQFYSKLVGGNNKDDEHMTFATFVELKRANERLVSERKSYEEAQKELCTLRAEHAELVALRTELNDTKAQLALVTSEKRALSILTPNTQPQQQQPPSLLQPGEKKDKRTPVPPPAKLDVDIVMKLESEVRRLNMELLRVSKESYEATSRNCTHDTQLKRVQDECERAKGQVKELGEQKGRLEKALAEKEQAATDMAKAITSYKENKCKLDVELELKNEALARYKANEAEMAAKIEKLEAEIAYHTSALSSVLNVRKDSLVSYDKIKAFLQEDHIREMYAQKKRHTRTVVV